jgi:hypothetical protein
LRTRGKATLWILGCLALGVSLAICTTQHNKIGGPSPVALAAPPTGVAPQTMGEEAPASELATPTPKAPPRFVQARESGNTSIVTDPLDPAYDAKALTVARSPGQVFDREPRDPAWAVPMERAFREEISRDIGDLVPGTRLTEVTCRKSSCQVVLEGPEKSTQDLLLAGQGIPYADSLQVEDEESGPGLARVSWTMVVDRRETPEQESFTRHYKERREAYLAKLRDNPVNKGPEAISVRLLQKGGRQ